MSASYSKSNGDVTENRKAEPRAPDLFCQELLERLTQTDGSREAEFQRLSRFAKAEPKRVSIALENWLNARLGLPRADAESIPLYHLLVGRFRAEGRFAFEEAENKLSFSELDELVRWRAQLWTRVGVGPQKVVALGRSFGSEFLLDLLAIFRLGACAAWIPPLGQPFEEAALVSVKPDFLCEVDEKSAQVVPHAFILEKPDPQRRFESPPSAPVDYGQKAPCLLVVSALTGDSMVPELASPSAISAPELLTALGRDAVLLWGLRDGDWMSAPGLDDRRHQPFLALSALLVGAGYHFLRQDDLCRVGPLTTCYRVFGLSGRFRDAILSSGCRVRTCRWFRVLEESGERSQWLAWQRWMGVEKEAYAVSLDPGLGGVALAIISAGDTAAESRTLSDTEFAHPALGLEWRLQLLPGAAPTDSVGFLQFKDERAAPPYLLVRESADGLQFLDVLEPRQRGQVFPGGITCAAVVGLPGVLGATLLPIPLMGSPGVASFGLIVFVAASAGIWTELRRDAVKNILARHLARVLHADLQPDFIEVHPILPHLSKDGHVDSAWVSGERCLGSLERRGRIEMFRQLAPIGLQELV